MGFSAGGGVWSAGEMLLIVTYFAFQGVATAFLGWGQGVYIGVAKKSLREAVNASCGKRVQPEARGHKKTAHEGRLSALSSFGESFEFARDCFGGVCEFFEPCVEVFR